MLKCGHCYNWMKKSDCPKEAKGMKPHAGMPACEKYSEEPWFTKLKLERGSVNAQ
jgi:hypothetical protein